MFSCESQTHMLMKSTPGVDFTNILHAAFTCTDPKSAKKDSQAKQLFALSGSVRVKAGRKHIEEIDPWCAFCQSVEVKE